MSQRATMSIPSSRRVFLTVLGATGVAACGGRVGDAVDDGTPSDPDPAVAGSDPGADDAAPLPAGECGGVDVGSVDDFQPGRDFHLFGSGRNTLIIANDDGSATDTTTKDGTAQAGLFAMSGLCTHARCPVQVRGTVWYCHCHGARFDFFGKTLSSVARRNLPRYAVSVCNGHVFVDTSQVVDPSTRA
jgi:Rieske Fe-S protein